MLTTLCFQCCLHTLRGGLSLETEVQVEALGVSHHLGKFTVVATSKAKKIAGWVGQFE